MSAIVPADKAGLQTFVRNSFVPRYLPTTVLYGFIQINYGSELDACFKRVVCCTYENLTIPPYLEPYFFR